MQVRISTALVLTAALILPANAAGAVKTGFDRQGAMRLTLKGRVLSAEIIRTPHFHRTPTTEQQLYGNRIDGICSPRFRPSRRHVLVQRRLWPTGERRLEFRFKRDISRRVKWCLIEHEAADIAFVSFIEPEPLRFVGKGRGPSGDWWRLGGKRGLFAEPCALLHTGSDGIRAAPCFGQFSERRVTLGAEGFGTCESDVFAFGVVSRSAASVRAVTADGLVQQATLFEPPRGSRVTARYFVAVLPPGTDISRVESLDASAATLARRAIEDEGNLCG